MPAFRRSYKCAGLRSRKVLGEVSSKRTCWTLEESKHLEQLVAEGIVMPTSDKAVETTVDGHYVVINGRKWRATDPSIPPQLRQELVDELMSARRAVKTGEEGARGRVNDAKIALGERGHPWWEAPDPAALEQRIMASIRALLSKRGTSSICPSEVARIVGGQDDAWRGCMGTVREVATAMAQRGEVVVTQKGAPVQAGDTRGPIRIAQGPRTQAPVKSENGQG